MTPALFLAPTDALAGDRVVLDGPEGRHAADVRRLRVGEPVSVADGCGLVVRGEVAEVSRGRVVVAVSTREQVPPSQPRLVVVQATAKGGRDTDAVEAMTEVGVDEVVGWQAERSVARWSERVQARWTATAREAAKQARRPHVPVVSFASSEEVAARLAAATLAVALHESATTPLASLAVPASGEVVLVVGPEGGLTDAEVDSFRSAGATPCRLGDAVLRASTAGVVALATVLARLG